MSICEPALNLKGKRVLVMGLGLHGGGVGTVQFLARHGARVTVTDLRSEAILKPSLTHLSSISGIRYVLGRHRKSDIDASDLILKNPGIIPSSPFLSYARKKGVPITSDIALFLYLCPGTVIGITGTRGKSTTAALIAHFLNNANRTLPLLRGRKIFLGGNIRVSVLQFLERMTTKDIAILELSSFQLDDLDHDSWPRLAHSRRAPHIAVITNILRDHLNWHGTMARYIRAKSALVRRQSKDDILFANGQDKAVRHIAAGTPGHVVFPKLPDTWRSRVDRCLGPHYRASVALAIAVGKHFALPETILARAFASFAGLEGRQEIVSRVRGISIVNDTTATIPDAAIAAIRRFRAYAGPHRLILIAGGQDKKLEFTPLAKEITRSVDTLILLPGTASTRLCSALQKIRSRVPLCRALSMEDAVAHALEVARKGDWIVLSPGAASFGLFLNEFDRGDQFIKSVRALS